MILIESLKFPFTPEYFLEMNVFHLLAIPLSANQKVRCFISGPNRKLLKKEYEKYNYNYNVIKEVPQIEIFCSFCSLKIRT